ncbi:MAG: acetyl-CoA carboxylase carboxyl transferase subunit beta [Gammaproteobacteria bacterium]|nr:acetyl-CoA carboxylase carboxyl transferase subunit beta [Gammaproteobacteria bacterium]
MNWLRRLIPSIGTFKSKSKVPDGLWSSCKKCEAVLYEPELEKSLYVCSKCDYHLRIGARKRINMFLDSLSYKEIAPDLTTKDPLKFVDLKPYKSRVKDAVAATGEKEAIVVVEGELESMPVVIAAFEFRFMGGSMGGVVGEKFVLAINKAIEKKSPLICFATSGGARMQESMISLMQMAKTSAAIQKLKKNNIPYISVLVDPIYGGVSASIAMLGDINIAEPNALSGFTGRRVIEQTVRIELPENFQTSEYLLNNGAIDMIVHRKDLRSKISSILRKIHKI